MFEKVRAFFLDALDWGRAIGLGILGVVMIAVFGVGICKVTTAAWVLAKTTLNGSEVDSAMAVTEFLKGFEFFFLAPLGLLTFKALIKYVRMQVYDPRKNVVSAKEDKEAAERDVHQLKILIGSLIAAFLITDLVSKVVSVTGRQDVWSLGSETAVLTATILYVWSLPQPHPPGAVRAG